MHAWPSLEIGVFVFAANAVGGLEAKKMQTAAKKSRARNAFMEPSWLVSG
jgi:hypothetical protein